VLATSPAVRISGAGSCRAAPAAPAIGQGPAPACTAEISPPGLKKRRARISHRLAGGGKEDNTRQRKSTVKSIQQNTLDEVYLS